MGAVCYRGAAMTGRGVRLRTLPSQVFRGGAVSFGEPSLLENLPAPDYSKEKMTDKQTPITEGMGKASTVDLARHGISILVGIILSRLVKNNLLTGEEVALLLGFLPSLIFNVAFSLWKRYRQRQNIATALMMPQGSTVNALKAVLNTAPPTAVIAASPESVTVVKEVEEEKE